jgi:hypothetical protein
MIERNRAMLDRVERIQEYDYIRSAFQPRQTAPFPSYQNVGYLRTRYAVEFASGNEREAIASVCRQIQTWRQLSARADILIDRSIGMAYSAEHNGRLLAQMLTEWPVDEPLPAPCGSALSPPELADVSICNAMRGEFQRMAFFNRNLHEHNEGVVGDLLLTFLIDAEASIGRHAQALGQSCDASTNERLLADRPAPEAEPPSVMRFACLGNLSGCISSALSAPALTAYEDATLDHGARLRVLATLARMRERAGDERSPEQLLEARPEAMKSPEREITFGPEGQTLQVGLYRTAYRDGSPVDHWSIPLPPALYREPGG